MTKYDAIVLGTGGVGAAAVYHLARQGYRVLGIDRFPGGHDRGSSHGHTRIIRMAYFEHPDYVPLLRRAYSLWAELEQARGQTLFFRVGLLEVGPADGIVIPGVLASAKQHALDVQQLDHAQLRSQFPGFHVPDTCQGVFEKNAGFLLVEQCVVAHLELAQRQGAVLAVGESVIEWSTKPEHVTVRTDRQTYQAARLIVTAGAWSGRLLSELGLSLQVRRKHLHWFRPETDSYRVERGGPCFFFEMPDGYFYGFPQIDERGVKLAEHSGGTVIEDPLQDDRSVEPRDLERVLQFLRQVMPEVTLEPTHHAVCYYTMSADEHFVVDRHPLWPSVVYAAGLSGHGFKFTSVLGEVLADLAMRGDSGQPIGFLSAARFS